MRPTVAIPERLAADVVGSNGLRGDQIEVLRY